MRMLSRACKIALWILGSAAIIVLVLYLGCSFMIGWGINSRSRSAMAQFDGDRVEALIAHVDCETCSPEDRTRAVWALGQLRDKRALPVLHKYRTRKPCDHLRQICQYEINKALRWIEGKSYMLPQMWRVMLRDDHPAAAKTPCNHRGDRPMLNG
jgi:hypothetical protein